VLNKTLGIVIKVIKYGESSAICHIYTQELGLIGFHIPAVFNGKGKGKIKSAYLQPLQLLEISFNYNKTKNLQSLGEASCPFIFNLTHYQNQAFYHVICELLQQSLKENEINIPLFKYLHQSLLPSINNPLHFWALPSTMVILLYFHGCAPNVDSYQSHSLLDLNEGIYRTQLLSLKNSAMESSSAAIYLLLKDEKDLLPLDAKLRTEVIDDLERYYKVHINEYLELKSRAIWGELMAS
jgi:DNA repair protein RecO (recombination protein O)